MNKIYVLIIGAALFLLGNWLIDNYKTNLEKGYNWLEKKLRIR